jgi:hypothetical protein
VSERTQSIFIPVAKPANTIPQTVSIVYTNFQYHPQYSSFTVKEIEITELNFGIFNALQKYQQCFHRWRVGG